jgi:sirohydrochlorin ferrochelatase
VESVAAALSSTVDVECLAGYATASGPTVGDAVAAVRAGGARRVAVVAYFLAAGRLYDVAVAAARAAGVTAITPPLGAVDELVELIVARAAAAVHCG